MRTVWISILAVILLAVTMPGEVHALLTASSSHTAATCHDDITPDHPVQKATVCDMGLCCLCPVTLPALSAAPVVAVVSGLPQAAVPRPLWPVSLDGIFHPPRA